MSDQEHNEEVARRLLMPGVTGFWNVRRTNPLAGYTPDWSAFRRACYGAGRAAGFDVLDVVVGEVARSFSHCHFGNRNYDFSCLCPVTMPVLAFVDGPPPQFAGPGDWRFVDPPEAISRSLAASGFKIAARSDLDARIDPKKLTWLTIADRTEIRGWQPETVGDIIYNYWD